MANFLFTRSFGRKGFALPGYQYDLANTEVESVLVPDAFRVGGAFAYFNKDSHHTQFGLYITNTTQNGNGVALPHGLFRWVTTLTGGDHPTTQFNLAIQDPLDAGATFTRITNAANSMGDIDHQYTWDNVNGSIQTNDGASHVVGRNGIWGNNTLANANIGNGMIKVALEVDDVNTGELKGYLKAAYINGNDATNGWGPQDNHTRCLVMELFGTDGQGDPRELLPLIIGPHQDLSGTLPQNIGPTIPWFRPKAANT